MSVPDIFRIGDKKIRCEYESPSGRRCRHIAQGVDHITPQVIAKIWKWTPAQTNSRENLQYLCHRHHRAKDKDTQFRAAVLRAQLRGEVHVGLGEHASVIKEYEHIEKEKRRILQQQRITEVGFSKLDRRADRLAQWKLRRKAS